MATTIFRMPTECITNPLQRELADSIIRMVPLDEIRILLACGAKVNEPVTQGLMPLHYAVWQRYYEATQLLLTRGGDVNAVDECGYSPLHLSAEHGFTEVVRLLLMSGAKVDYRLNTGEEFPRTTLCDEPLRLAIRNKHMNIARMLLEHGADPNKRYFFGSEINLVTDLDYLELLLTFGANPDSRDRSGLTPLMKAARQPQGMEAVLLLIKYGANVNAIADERHDYRTVLHYAVLSGNVDIVNLLVKQGAKLNYDDVYDFGKPSPLDLAILKGDPKIVSLLIGAGANVNCSSPILGSPLHVACADNIPNRFEILQMLLNEGADPNLKVYNDIMDRNSQLRPVLVEYLASNENLNVAVVNLLLKYGARVVMKTQFRDPGGVLNSLQNVVSSRSDAIFILLLEACESFDTCMIRRNNVITPEQKTALLELARSPLTLKRQKFKIKMGVPKIQNKDFYLSSAMKFENLSTSSNYLNIKNNNNNNNNIIEDVMTNNIGEFYRDASIFITGGTGFVGKALLEKLLRSCEYIDSVYLLVRAKRGLAGEQRLKELLKNPVFNRIKELNPALLDKIKIIEGDVSLPNLGISEIDREKLTEKINIVFHSAATVRFDENLKEAVVLNTLGTKRVVEFSSEMKHLKSFVHVSTAYSNADRDEVEEIVYKPPFDPKALINCIELLPDDAVDLLTKKIMGAHPNTYTLTKALAEYVVLEYSGQLPVAIVRPSIVTAAWKEPFPGWVDNISGITGIMMEIGRGSIKSIICDEKLIMDLIPVDIVANTLVTVAWHTNAYRSNTMRVYNCTSGEINKVSWRDFGKLTQNYARLYPTKYISWYPNFSYRTNRFVHWIYSVLFHTMPACIFDVILYCTKHKPMMYKISKKFERACKSGEFFALNEWKFHTSTVGDLIKAVENAEDGNKYNVDVSEENGFNWDPYVKDFMLGIRQYVLKDDISSLPKARVKLNTFYWASKILQLISIYLALKIVTM